MLCQPMTLNLNGTEIPVGQTNNSFCGTATSNTLCAPAGFTYSWTGPGVTGQTGQCINTSSTGTFLLLWDKVVQVVLVQFYTLRLIPCQILLYLLH